MKDRPAVLITHASPVFVLYLVLVLSTGFATTLNIDCGWRGTGVMIDSINEDWGDAVYYSQPEKISLTLLNDSAYLYFRIITRDLDRMQQIVRTGCTVWFDPAGGKDRTYGIHFPLGRRIGGRLMMEPPLPDQENPAIPESLFTPSLADANELEIVGPGKDNIWPLSLTNAEKQGLKVMIGMMEGSLVYILKIPLTRDTGDIFSIGIGLDSAAVTAAKKLGIGLETAEMKKGGMPGRMEPDEGMPDMGGSGMPGGGMSGGGPPNGNFPGGGPPGRGPGNRPKPLKVWAIVRLAPPSSIPGNHPDQ